MYNARDGIKRPLLRLLFFRLLSAPPRVWLPVRHTYHLVPVPEEVPDVMLSTFAYMRQIAEPLVKKKDKGDRADSGFWKAMDKGLEARYDDYGKGDRATITAWVEWGKGKVAWDEHSFPLEDNIVIVPNEVHINQSLKIAQGDENDVGVTVQNADAYLTQGGRNVTQLEAQMGAQANATIALEDEEGEDVDMNVIGPQLQSLADM